jgi:hypothetical protein
VNVSYAHKTTYNPGKPNWQVRARAACSAPSVVCERIRCTWYIGVLLQ